MFEFRGRRHERTRPEPDGPVADCEEEISADEIFRTTYQHLDHTKCGSVRDVVLSMAEGKLHLTAARVHAAHPHCKVDTVQKVLEKLAARGLLELAPPKPGVEGPMYRAATDDPNNVTTVQPAPTITPPAPAPEPDPEPEGEPTVPQPTPTPEPTASSETPAFEREQFLRALDHHIPEGMPFEAFSIVQQWVDDAERLIIRIRALRNQTVSQSSRGTPA